MRLVSALQLFSYWPFHRWVSFVDRFCYLSLSLPYLFLAALCSPVGKLLISKAALGSLVCDVFLCFCHFPIWCPGSGVVLDCVDS